MPSSFAAIGVAHVPYMKLLPDEEYSAVVEHARLVLDCVPPGSVLSHVTAAQLHGIPLPASALLDSRTHVVRPLPATQARVPGVRGHRALHPREVTTIRGLPVTGLADTFADLGELIGRGKPLGLDDAVVAGDACATMLESVVPLRRAIDARVRPRGKRTLVEALQLVRVGAASPRETIARLMFVRAGLPEPKLNEPVRSADDPDRILGFADLLWRVRAPDGTVQRLVGEYQGEAFHSLADQRGRDDVRARGFADEGWPVEEMWKADLATEAARVQTVLRFASRLGLPRSALTLSAVGPRFFASHVIEEAIQRSMAAEERHAERDAWDRRWGW
ncbi:hypothetical protein [Intrasporangium sp. YIM S08009]|uniref:hypothetical protein n=1 Tax=Intrasporangium zincisolvens TaxID=3080018 RepID=UPI002B0590B5|nr:hypothetical protein [Intrasporangium sp. YIM S08009]